MTQAWAGVCALCNLADMLSGAKPSAADVWKGERGCSERAAKRKRERTGGGVGFGGARAIKATRGQLR